MKDGGWNVMGAVMISTENPGGAILYYWKGIGTKKSSQISRKDF